MNEFNAKIFGERLRYLRNERGIGQNFLAKELNLSNASISYWETGKEEPTASALYRLAVYFGVSADYLLGISDEWQ